jgi:acyl-CoA thioesterase-1
MASPHCKCVNLIRPYPTACRPAGESFFFPPQACYAPHVKRVHAIISGNCLPFAFARETDYRSRVGKSFLLPADSVPPMCLKRRSLALILSLICLLDYGSHAAADDGSKPIEIVMLGDSITKGVRTGVKAEETFAALLERVLKDKGHAVRVTNAGIGGEKTDQALARLEKDVIAKKPTLVAIMYGTNDSWIDRGKTEPRLTLEQFRENTLQLVKQLQQAGIRPILMTEPSHGKKSAANGLDEHPNQRLEKYVAVTREIAQELKLPLIDHYAEWTTAEGKGHDLTDWTTDQYHPNPAGHAHMAELILPVMLKEIE